MRHFILPLSLAWAAAVLWASPDGASAQKAAPAQTKTQSSIQQTGQQAAQQARPKVRFWDARAWIRAHPERACKTVTTQSGHKDPAPFVGKDWKAEVAQFRAAWSEIIGPIPKSARPLQARDEPLGLSAAERTLLGTGPFRVSKVSYVGAHGGRIPAFLLVPSAPGRRPAVLVMHQSLIGCGKKEPIGACVGGNPDLAMARDLARKGYVALAPDSIGYGERAQAAIETSQEYSDAAPILDGLPGATLMGLRISDVQRGIDYLAAHPKVDKARIGMMGHSNGGIETVFSAAFEPRIRCAVSNAGPNLIRRETISSFGLTPGIDRWAGFGFLPALAQYDGRLHELPVEIHQLYAMVAPRGLFVALIEDDSIAPRVDRADFAIEQARRAFAGLGGRFSGHVVRSGLSPACQREMAVPFCVGQLYEACLAGAKAKQSADPCLARFSVAGIDQACVDAHGGVPYQCAWDLYWKRCIQGEGRTEQECQARFTDPRLGLGVTPQCIKDGAFFGCRRDHGFYPETRELAYPWLESCLSSP
jgi:dienelactone hydrolase